jgi:hypothetical protein
MLRDEAATLVVTTTSTLPNPKEHRRRKKANPPRTCVCKSLKVADLTVSALLIAVFLFNQPFYCTAKGESQIFISMLDVRGNKERKLFNTAKVTKTPTPTWNEAFQV